MKSGMRKTYLDYKHTALQCTNCGIKERYYFGFGHFKFYQLRHK